MTSLTYSVQKAVHRILKRARSGHIMDSALGSQNGPTKPEKLHGRAFYESIGSPKFVLAPMVDQSEFVRDRAVVQISC